MKTLFTRFLPLLLSTSAALMCAPLTGCGSGGGGGGGDFVGAANTSITLTPSKIDSGDRTKVTVTVSEVHDNGIALKIRFPQGLRYVSDSSTLVTSEKDTDLSPAVNTASKDGGDVYLVFYLSQSLFRTSGQEYNGESGEVQFQLEGVSAISDGSVEVDADVDDPSEDNSTEFDISNPEFAPEDEANISVVD